jgi:hypothetical protein
VNTQCDHADTRLHLSEFLLFIKPVCSDHSGSAGKTNYSVII